MKVSYALKLLREYIIWPQMKILDIDLIVTNKKCMQKYRKLNCQKGTPQSEELRHSLCFSLNIPSKIACF